ncbi:MAG: DUF1285 domain-containing protein [Pseudomonadota bacterium]
MIVKPSAEGLAASAAAAGRKGPPPVHLWNPPYCGDLDIRIARDGTWFYLGTPIGRAPLVRLFSSILKREGDRYFLVTPAEKVGITVEDAPLFAVDFTNDAPGPDQIITFHTKTGDDAVCDADHPLRVARDPKTGEPAPYMLVRAGLEARIDRKSFYRLVELGTTETLDGEDWFGIRSSGHFFPVIPAKELP